MRKLILLCLMILGTFVIAKAQTYQELTERGLELLEKDSLELAEDFFRQAMKLEPANPHNALLFSNIGLMQQRMNNYEDALESFTLALNIAPRAIPILLNRAALYLELGLTDKAYIDYCQVIDDDKNNTEALLMRAYIYVTRRDYKAARIDYNRLLGTDPSNYNGRLGLVGLNQKEKKYADGLAIVDQLIVEFPQDVTLYLMRAGIEVDMGQFEAALLDYEKAIRINPKSADAYLYRGELYLQQSKKTLAKQDFEKAISLGIPQSELRDQLQKCR